MPKKLDPRSVMEADWILVDVPDGRFLPRDEYQMAVRQVGAKRKHRQSFILRYEFGGRSFLTRGVVFSDARLKGQIFLDCDQYPCSYTHQPNLENRLRLSLAAKGKRA